MSRRWAGSGAGWPVSQSPRRMSSTASPARLRAQRWPAWPRSALRFCTCRLRTRAAGPLGARRRLSPTATWPAWTVPATMVPAPARVNTRSTARRKSPSAARAGRLRAASTRWLRRASTPAPVRADTGKIGAPARQPPASRAWICALTSARRSGLARSALVRATAPRRMPSRLRICRCSRVCGIGPSSAATMSSAKSMPLAPASMVGTNFSWPGTSTKPITRAGEASPPGSGR